MLEPGIGNPLPPGSRLFITGGTGFFGKTLLSAVTTFNVQCDARCEVVVLSRDPQRFLATRADLARHPWLSFVQGDIADFNFPAGLFTHVIHAAIDASGRMESDPLGWFVHLIAGTRRVLDFTLASGAGKFLLTSSGAAYGPQPEELEKLPEIYRGAPDTTDSGAWYGQAKRIAEHMCTLYRQRHGLQTKIARCFAFVGEDLPLAGSFAVGNFIADALHGDAIRVKGDGSPLRSYLYGADMAIWLLTILERGRAGQIYNVGSDRAIDIASLAHLVADTLAPGKPVLIEKARVDYAGRQRYIPDLTRVRRELGLEVWTDLPTAIVRSARGKR